MNETSKKVLAVIRKGRLDEDLEELAQAILNRRLKVLNSAFYDLEIDDRVIMRSTIRPKYMVGQVGTLVRKSQNKGLIQLDKPQRRFGSYVWVSGTSLEKLS